MNEYRYGAFVDLAQEAEDAVQLSVDTVKHILKRGLVVYGVNTGFGGSADTRSAAVETVQDTLMRGLHYGVLLNNEPSNSFSIFTQSNGSHDVTAQRLMKALPLDDPASATSMPESWSRAAMLIRLNSLSSGASGVQLKTVETLADLINKNITPRIPLRGSISASGDLSPLGYIGGAMQGKPTIQVWAGNRPERKLTRASIALKEANISPISLRPKEGLAIVNGTAVSAGVAALTLHESYCLAALSQVLTAMSVEALCGTDESFDPFIARVRPHPGQIDSAQNIFSFLHGSKLVYRNDGKEDMTLRQDRYSIRTASQWIGPVLEDLLLAHSQLTIELNSVTDNPIINNSTGQILHGGNFQAKAVTSAMEKTRAGLQTIGRMLFTQCTELINPATNRGLPPNLVVDDPSVSFIWKGTDIMIASLASELGYLSNLVSPHVQTAEMGNQALNSLALISARYTLIAVDVLTQMSAAHLLALCQAFDLRAMEHKFLTEFKRPFRDSVSELFMTANRPWLFAEKVEELWALFLRRLNVSMSLDVGPRMFVAVEALQPLLLKFLPARKNSVEVLLAFGTKCAAMGIEVYERNRTEYREKPDATPLLGRAGKRMYLFLREKLGVPFFGEKEITTIESSEGTESEGLTPTVGGYISTIYEAMRKGILYGEVVECLRELEKKDGKKPVLVGVAKL